MFRCLIFSLGSDFFYNAKRRGSNDLSLHVVEAFGNNRCHQIEINLYHDSTRPCSESLIQNLPISNSETDLAGKVCATLAQLRSGYCGLLGAYKSSIKKGTSLDVCADCGMTPHDVIG